MTFQVSPPTSSKTVQPASDTLSLKSNGSLEEKKSGFAALEEMVSSPEAKNKPVAKLFHATKNRISIGGRKLPSNTHRADTRKPSTSSDVAIEKTSPVLEFKKKLEAQLNDVSATSLATPSKPVTTSHPKLSSAFELPSIDGSTTVSQLCRDFDGFRSEVRRWMDEERTARQEIVTSLKTLQSIMQRLIASQK
jgi:hypothetical protein